MSDFLPWFVVFDLDDTLIAESDYQISGINAVEQHLEELLQKQVKGFLLAAHSRGVSDLWGFACDLLKLPPAVAQSLLWVYRLHTPKISLQPGVFSLLNSLSKKNIPFVILSDGRSSTQRLKIQAVDLQHIPCYISEEWGSSKPDLLRFQVIEEHWPDRHYVYVGDNPAKDFFAPVQLGWLTLGAAWTPDPVHPQDPGQLHAGALQPHGWLQAPDDLLKWLR